jgi:hypothetical protein|nr:MAG TPA: HNH endonuclease [Caudoviricetes sp.]DAW45877.1 MAG TPA: HNH endonuclease [Caudoviricetes sp.]
MNTCKKICNWCGREIKPIGSEQGISFEHQYSYGSQLDGSLLSFDLCPECSERLPIVLGAMFVHNPLKDDF